VPGAWWHASGRHPLAHLQQTAGHHVDQLLPCRRGHGAGHLDIARYITTPKGEIAGRVLLVDDLADTGHTLKAVFEMLKSNYAPITELRSAVIWTKGVSTFVPDYSVEFLPTNPWIHQPFENYDSMSPEMLLEKWKL
jgi:hypoxanthine phosphoribosyltransferase